MSKFEFQKLSMVLMCAVTWVFGFLEQSSGGSVSGWFHLIVLCCLAWLIAHKEERR